MPGIPMSVPLANQMAGDWLALRAVWEQVALSDRAPALAYFQLSESILFSADRSQLVAEYTGSSPVQEIFMIDGDDNFMVDGDGNGMAFE